MSDSWSIAVRTVGGGKHVDSDDAQQQHQQDFSVTVSPDDDLTSLHHEIECVTGLKASQQRLIYRGRLISNGHNEECEKKETVRSIAGLCDGQTIHLVPKREERESTTDNTTDGPNSSSDEDNNVSSSDGGVGRSLLATLLGLGSLDGDDDGSDADVAASPSMRRLRRNRSRRTGHRLSQENIVVPDPGSMEPVRQGLMTLHTMLETEQTERPWDANRQWYRGQWVDCRDTVNQWLEATVVDIAHPDDILPERTLSNASQRRTTSQPATDDAVSANDYEGRRNLLLQPDGQGGVCERPNNHGVHLLLIHYNSWPHRWDEWIRSDSERLRPFRTRTRHNPTTGALPAPQSVFDGAPSTSIKEEDEEGDRAALLPELSRTMASINDILQEAVASSHDGQDVSDASRPSTDLPWLTDADDFPSAWSTENEPRYDRRQLEALAPLLDRLGRTLTDAAPHVASFAATLPYEDGAFPAISTTDPENNVVIVGEGVEEPPPAPPAEETTTSSSGFFSLLSRGDSRSRTSSASRGNEISEVDESERDDIEVIEPDYVDFVNGAVNTSRGETRSGRRNSSDDGASLLGAYLALSSLASEGESNSTTGGGGSGLLGRLLRERGNNDNDGGSGGGGGGPAIDIHIHAIVTGPGVGPGAMGMAMMGVPPPPPLANATTTPNTNSGHRGLFSSRRGIAATESQRATAAATDEDDMGIFDDLYSENPDPLDPNNNVVEAAAASDVHIESAGRLRSRNDEGVQNEGPSPNRSYHGRSRLEHQSASRPRSLSSQRSRRSPRRGGTFGRVVRSVFSQSRGRRTSAHGSDAESI